jgi:hypothetical protein
VPENALLLYKKKFYYHDGSEDCNNDPVYYNLLFYQSRDAIISNVYTCNMEEAVQLAATLFQINFGDHNPNIHKPGFLKYVLCNVNLSHTTLFVLILIENLDHRIYDFSCHWNAWKHGA